MGAADRTVYEHDRRLSVEQRLDEGTSNPFRPGIDDGPPGRAFATMAEYRQWRSENLPRWLGYHRVTDEEWEKEMNNSCADDEKDE